MEVVFKIQRALEHLRDEEGRDTGELGNDVTLDMEELEAVLEGRLGDKPIPFQMLNVIEILFKQSVSHPLPPHYLPSFLSS